jgi:tetratricopeptide (TPR) repeat protein
LAGAYNNLGDIYRRKGNFETAIKYYVGSIKVNPSHKQAYNNLGAQYADRGYLLESLPYLCKALLIDPSFKDANTNFDFVSSRIQGLDNKSFTLLHNQMLQGNIFKPSLVKDNITIQNKDCSFQQGCILTFNANLKQNEFLFPFLIYASTPNGEVVRIRYSAFNQTKQGYQIALGIDHQFGNSAIHFYIPTCDGIYYETKTQ